MRLLKLGAVAALTLSSAALAQNRPSDEQSKQDRPEQKAQDKNQERDQRNAGRAQPLPSGTQRDDFQAPTEWRKGSDLTRSKLMGKNNSELGQFQDAVIDPATGRVVYGVLSSRDSSTAGRNYLVPWSAIETSRGASGNTYTANINEDTLKGAPNFTQGQWPQFNDQATAESIYKHYGQQPYWTARQRNVAAGVGGTAGREDWYHYPTSWTRLNELRGMSVTDQENRRVGELSDIAIDPHTGRIMYGVVNSQGRLHAVPWSAISVNPNGRTATVKARGNTFSEQHGFTPENWPNMTDRSWAREVYSRYETKPYWSDSERPEDR